MKKSMLGKLRILICVILSLCLVLPLAACGNDDKPDGPGGTPAKKITVNPTTVTVVAGEDTNVTATLTGITGDVTWTSADPTVAKVEVANAATTTVAKITGVKSGSTTVKAEADGVSASVSVTVTAAQEEVETVTIKINGSAVGATPYDVQVGKSLTFTA